MRGKRLSRKKNKKNNKFLVKTKKINLTQYTPDLQFLLPEI